HRLEESSAIKRLFTRDGEVAVNLNGAGHMLWLYYLHRHEKTALCGHAFNARISKGLWSVGLLAHSFALAALQLGHLQEQMPKLDIGARAVGGYLSELPNPPCV
ncbi:hypothetical protein BaRGS_00009380, partial [Batillaria attramentaria]